MVKALKQITITFIITMAIVMSLFAIFAVFNAPAGNADPVMDDISVCDQSCQIATYTVPTCNLLGKLGLSSRSADLLLNIFQIKGFTRDQSAEIVVTQMQLGCPQYLEVLKGFQRKQQMA